MGELKRVFTRSTLKAEVVACLALAIPLAGAQLAQAATTFADTIMMGLLGRQTLAAGGLASMTFSAILITSTGIVTAVSPIVAEAYGAGKPDKVSQVARHGLWVAVLLAIPVMVLVWNLTPVMRQSGQEEMTVQLAEDYLHAIVWGFLPALGFAVLRSFVSALSQPRPVLVIMAVGTLFNIAANYTLMFGKLGFPVLGIAGIGWASMAAFWFMFLALALYIQWRSDLRCYRIFRGLHQFDRHIFQEILQIGWPIGVLFAVETGLFTATTYLMGQLGTDTLAAHQIVLQTAAVTFMVPLGISYATTVRVGLFNGREDPGGAQLAGYVGIGIGACFMAVMALLFFATPQSIIALYLDIRNPENAGVVAIASSLLAVAGLFQIVDGIQSVAGGALRGLKDTRIPMVIGIVAYWGIGLTSGYIMGFKLAMDGVGLWLGLAVGLAIAATVLTWRFHSLIAPRI